MADRFALRRVFQNLLDNAIKFTPQGGKVEVVAKEEGDAFHISVCDTGIGIPPEEEERLFKRFSQGKKGKAHSAGIGLGLYLCKQIVDAHRGTLTFTSGEQNGTTFSITIPKGGSIADRLQ